MPEPRGSEKLGAATVEVHEARLDEPDLVGGPVAAPAARDMALDHGSRGGVELAVDER